VGVRESHQSTFVSSASAASCPALKKTKGCMRRAQCRESRRFPADVPRRALRRHDEEIHSPSTMAPRHAPCPSRALARACTDTLLERGARHNSSRYADPRGSLVRRSQLFIPAPRRLRAPPRTPYQHLPDASIKKKKQKKEKKRKKKKKKKTKKKKTKQMAISSAPHAHGPRRCVRLEEAELPRLTQIVRFRRRSGRKWFRLASMPRTARE